MSTILVVDDDPDFVEITRWILSSQGYQVVTAPDGEAALKCLEETPPAAVLLDVMMASVLDGLDVARRMSEDSELSRIPVIMVSSITDSPMAELFPTDEYLPVDAWLTKPVSADALLAQLDRVLDTAA